MLMFQKPSHETMPFAELVHLEAIVQEHILPPWSHLLANRTTETGLPLGRLNFESKSFFHFVTASNVAGLVTSKTINAPIASAIDPCHISKSFLTYHQKETKIKNSFLL